MSCKEGLATSSSSRDMGLWHLIPSVSLGRADHHPGAWRKTVQSQRCNSFPQAEVPNNTWPLWICVASDQSQYLPTTGLDSSLPWTWEELGWKRTVPRHRPCWSRRLTEPQEPRQLWGGGQGKGHPGTSDLLTVVLSMFSPWVASCSEVFRIWPPASI